MMAGLTVSTLEGWLWDAACSIRGPLDAPKFKDCILPLIFLKRPSDVFEDEVGPLTHEFGDRGTAAKLVEQDHKLVRAESAQAFENHPYWRTSSHQEQELRKSLYKALIDAEVDGVAQKS